LLATFVQCRGMGQGAIEIRGIEIILSGNPDQREQR
jgi:hypothetical protein